MSDHEYKVTTESPSGDTGSSSGPYRDPRAAGNRFREARKSIEVVGGKATLHRRLVGPWESVEVFERPGPDAGKDPNLFGMAEMTIEEFANLPCRIMSRYEPINSDQIKEDLARDGSMYLKES